jgi:hypothetical protein
MVAPTRLAVGSTPVGLVVVVDECGHVGIDPEDDVSSVAPVAAIWPTQRLELLAMHGRDAVAAISTGDVEHHSVNERRDRHGVDSSGVGGSPTDSLPPRAGAASG